MKTELRHAIDRSISHTEIVRVEVDSPRAALADIASDDSVTDFDWIEADGLIDVWGYRLAGEFRLHIRKAQ